MCQEILFEEKEKYPIQVVLICGKVWKPNVYSTHSAQINLPNKYPEIQVLPVSHNTSKHFGAILVSCIIKVARQSEKHTWVMVSDSLGL